ncbi:MAG: hypothetical protein PHE29_02080 [Tissierellia bacterium]|nr:hypothetical protein [Tissierellia bacterium]
MGIPVNEWFTKENNMPFKSQAQRAYMYAKHPKLAKEFESETPKGKKLPKKLTKKVSKKGKKK